MTQLIAIEKPARSLFWTAPPVVTSEMNTEDPLGLDYISQQVGLLLLPTLTTRSSRAQAYAVVLYGLDLARRGCERHGYSATDDKRRELFERWERFWALATLEYHGGPLPLSHRDAMRGIRGATAAWRPGERPLLLDFQLISRQQELGQLGAYLVPLRKARLVVDGGFAPTPAAEEIIANFWGETAEQKRRPPYEEYAMLALDLGRKSIDRKVGNVTLKKVGERSRLTALGEERAPQQRRLYSALVESIRDDTTIPIVGLVESAARQGVFSTPEILDAALTGKLGALNAHTQALLTTARDFGRFLGVLLRAFDRTYATLDQGGWVLPSDQVAEAVFDHETLRHLREASQTLLSSPFAGAIASLPVHGPGCIRLAQTFLDTDAKSTLSAMLSYHHNVQRDRRRAVGWIREEAGKLVLGVTSYRPFPDNQRFPGYKLDVVRSLLVDTGRWVPATEGGEA